MIEQYLPVFFLIFLAVSFGVVSLIATNFIGPKRPNKVKNSPYESGMEPVGTAHERFSVKYYMVAMIFVVFDVEILFMYPWAVQFDALGLFALIEMIIFIALLFVGYFYIIRKGVLEWE
ncbi:MAG: NADH-quinone oxidoreductase subunit A [Bacteroidetes bacterium]|nr:NADH-quinone oxidoreductase subunit A [Bacteroidota bacterium]